MGSTLVLVAAVCRGEHTPLTSCYYLLMDSLGIRERGGGRARVTALPETVSEETTQSPGAARRSVARC